MSDIKIGDIYERINVNGTINHIKIINLKNNITYIYLKCDRFPSYVGNKFTNLDIYNRKLLKYCRSSLYKVLEGIK